ncbi:hypothetical protein ig2599ANME_0930 [groundwater metagenome]
MTHGHGKRQNMMNNTGAGQERRAALIVAAGAPAVSGRVPPAPVCVRRGQRSGGGTRITRIGRMRTDLWFFLFHLLAPHLPIFDLRLYLPFKKLD